MPLWLLGPRLSLSPQPRLSVATSPHAVLRLLLLDFLRPAEEVAHVFPRLGWGGVAPFNGAPPKAKDRAPSRLRGMVPLVCSCICEQPLHRGVVLHPHMLQGANELLWETSPYVLAATLASESPAEECSPQPRALSRKLGHEQHASWLEPLRHDFFLVLRTFCTQLQAYLG